MPRALRLGLICLALAAAAPAFAAGFARVGTFGFQSEGIFVSGRMSAMGSADLTDGSPAAALLNPAPLAEEDGVFASYDHAAFFADTAIHTYAASARWHGVSLNVVDQDLVVDDQLIRTAYNPEGTGETFDARDRMTVTGLSWAPRVRLGVGFLRVAAGAAWRHYDARLASSSVQVDGLDVGATVGWRQDVGRNWMGVTGALAWSNVTDGILTFDGRMTNLPRPRRGGLTFAVGLRRPDDRDDLLALRLAYASETDLNHSRSDCDRAGVEVLYRELIALRYGHSDRLTGGIASWGVGVVFDRWLGDRVTLAADYGLMSYDNDILDDDQAIWGVRGGVRF